MDTNSEKEFVEVVIEGVVEILERDEVEVPDTLIAADLAYVVQAVASHVKARVRAKGQRELATKAKAFLAKHEKEIMALTASGGIVGLR